MTRLRLAFMGTPDFAVPSLRALIDAGHDVAAVYTQPPRPAGRGHRERRSPVHEAALTAGIEVRHPGSLKDAGEQAAFAALGLDAAVVAAYGLILPKPILDAPRLGCVNVHASLLPRWRGAAPIQRAILAGDEETGVTIMMMEAGLDTGPMLLKAHVPIAAETDAGTLHDALAGLGAELIVPALAGLADGSLRAEPQPEDGVTYAAKITKEDGRLDWEDAALADRQVRALTPWPGVWFDHEADRIKVLAIETVPDAHGAPGEVLDDRLTIACARGGAVRPLRLQRPGKGPVDAQAFLRGYPLPAGIRL
ncbi:methionyl-tRNA formyltransferase [Inquilinus sp. CAU 1745]|uniref:methionyl-tRNA formyltransferase n=1 Tax=Inquilinus sp. CAU 1745 TaxID=3140369 RepID=UPI00325AC877